MDQTWQPETEFPHVGHPGQRLYRVGLCKVCNLLLMGEQPVRRDYCWLHDPNNVEKTD